MITDLGYMVEFDDELVLMQKRCLDPSQGLAKGVCESDLYKMPGDLVRNLVHNTDNLCDL